MSRPQLPPLPRLISFLVVVAALFGMHVLTVGVGQCHATAVGLHVTELSATSDHHQPTTRDASAQPTAAGVHNVNDLSLSQETIADPELAHAGAVLCIVVLIVGAICILGLGLGRWNPVVSNRMAQVVTRIEPERTVPVYLQLLTLRL